MKILFFDTETTGLPKNWKAPVHQLDNWPRLVQIAWQVYNSNGDLLEEHEYVIKPVGFIIPSEASAVHKITTQKALKIGEDLLTILKVFRSSVKGCEILVAHNYSYDYNIMGSELLRNGLENSLYEKEHICTMNASTEFCKIAGPYGYKWPKLEELHDILFSESFNAHDALDDIRATARCFWKLSSLNIIKIKPTTEKLENSSNEIKQWKFSDFGEDLKILIFSAKGDGLPKKRNAPPEHIQNWPRLESIAWEVYNQDGKRIDKDIYENLLSLDDGEDSQSNRMDNAENGFHDAFKGSDIIVAHDYSLNYSVIAAQLYRSDKKDYVRPGIFIKTATKLKEKLHVCTMESSGNLSSTPGQTTTGSNVVDLVNATGKVFWELKTKGELKRPVKFVNDKIHGKLKGVTCEGNDGQTICEATVNYIKGIKQGEEELYFLSPERLFKKTNYVNDLKNGIEETYGGGKIEYVESYNETSDFWEEKYIDFYIRFSVNYIDGEKHGEEKEYDESKVLKSLKNWISNKQHGEEKEYYESGKLMKTVNWIEGKRNGEEKEYYESGVLKRRTMYNSTLYEISQVITNFSTVGKRNYDGYGWDRKHGEEKEYYETEVLKSVVNYFNGDRRGIYREFYESGLLRKTVNFGLITYYEKWLKKGMGHTYFKKQGEEKEFYESGVLIRTVNYIDGEKDGEEKEFYESGVLKESRSWWGRDLGDIPGWKSRKYGEEFFFYESGALKILVIHAKKTKLPASGNFNGNDEPWDSYWGLGGDAKELEKEFYESGALKSTLNYLEGKKSGESKFFRKNGQISGVKNYIKGKRSGEEIWFYESDHSDEPSPIYGTFQWSESMRNGKAKRFYKSGVLKESSTFINNVRKGEAKTYYESGALKYVVNFNGFEDGEGKIFYESGALRTIIPFEGKYGAQEGQAKNFYESGELESTIDFKARFPVNNIGYYKSGELKWEQSYERIYSSQAGGGKWHSLKAYHKSGELKNSIQLDPIYLENNWYKIFHFSFINP